VVGWEAIRRSFEEAWPRFEEFSVAAGGPMQVRVGQGGALVVAVTPVRQKLRGGDATEYTVLGTSVFERRDGRWLLVHHHAPRVPQ
jgi:ketosteroid isomerase-like protein